MPFSPAALSYRIKHLLPIKLCTDRGSPFNLFSHELCTAHGSLLHLFNSHTVWRWKTKLLAKLLIYSDFVHKARWSPGPVNSKSLPISLSKLFYIPIIAAPTSGDRVRIQSADRVESFFPLIPHRSLCVSADRRRSPVSLWGNLQPPVTRMVFFFST